MSIFLDLIKQEEIRQEHTVELIASENFVSNEVLTALGSRLTNKYSEGYPKNRDSGNKGRYYGGCHVVDEIEQKCCDLWKQVFQTDYHVNVQPHSGTQANMAAYFAVAQPGDTILSMSLAHGGHLSHGSPVNFSGKLYHIVEYGVTKEGRLDYADLERKLYQHTPRILVVGASAYSRIIEFDTIFDIVQRYRNATNNEIYYIADIAHIAGLVAAQCHPTPFNYADIITTTTHKTLRGPRGALIFCRPELAKKIDSAVFPGTQGGPLQHAIAAKGVAAEECLQIEYQDYIRRVIENSKTMAQCFLDMGFDVVTGGTDNHLFLIDLSKTHPHITGREVQEALDKINITLNKNCVPGEERTPKETSGLRIGTAAMTTRGYGPKDFCAWARQIGAMINALEADSLRE